MQREHLNLEELESALEEINAKFLIKLHPLQNIQFNVSEYENILLLENVSDVYPLLTESDMLITDYSSILFDYLHTDNRMIFYAYDLDEYIEDRGLYYEYEDLVPGPVVEDSKNLVNQVSIEFQTEDEYKNERKEMLERFFNISDGKARKRVIEKAKKEVKDER